MTTTDFAGLMPNTEHTPVRAFAQTNKTKRGCDYHRCLQLVVQENDPMFLSTSDQFLHTFKWLTEQYESYPTFKGIWAP